MIGRILFFDPGGTTAWVLYNPLTVSVVAKDQFRAIDMTDERIHDQLQEIFQRLNSDDRVGHEVFFPGTRGIDMTAQRVIKQIEIVCREDGREPFLQLPACMITTTPLAKDILNRSSVHIIDALAHAIYYSRKHKE